MSARVVRGKGYEVPFHVFLGLPLDGSRNSVTYSKLHKNAKVSSNRPKRKVVSPGVRLLDPRPPSDGLTDLAT
jgi:hypothetical protein